ncbi:MAG: cytochrome P450 [Myxococcota bacterium]
MSQAVQAEEYDPFSDAVMRDPWPFYRALREEAPVYYHPDYDTWFLSCFEDIRAATVNEALTAERGVTPEMVILKAPPPPDPVFSMLDGPRQRAHRRLFAPAYGKQAILSLEPRIRERVRARLAPLLRQGGFDVYRDLADPVAAEIIGELIGFPAEESLELRAFIAANFKREPGQKGNDAKNSEAQMAVMIRIAGLIAARQEHGGSGESGDHLSVMLGAEIDGKPLSMETMVASAYTLLVTGAEVVPLSVANTIYYLADHPDQRSRLTGDPTLIPHAFAESLRFDQPTNLLGRVVQAETEIRGQRLSPGQGVMFLWASGNRDESEFVDADRFDIMRRPKRSLSYGHGVHKCIGEHLGNLEGRILLEEILAAAPNYRVNKPEAERVYSEFLHGYHRMPIEF